MVSAVAVIAIALFALMGFKYYLDAEASKMRIQVGEAEFSARLGDFAQAEEQAQRVLDGIKGGENFGAYTVVEVAKFMSGDEASRLEAVRIAKQHYGAASTRTKALIINMLTGFVAAQRDDRFFNEIFSGEPFGALKVENDPFLTIRKFAELSNTLSPTSVATHQIATWHAARILSAQRLKLTVDERKGHAASIISLADEAATLFAQEEPLFETALFGELNTFQYHNQRAYLYGATAYVEPQYFMRSEEEYAILYTRYGEGRGDPIVQSWLPSAYLNNALFLRGFGGKARDEDVRNRLNSLVALVESDPDLYKNTFLNRIVALKGKTEATGGAEYRQFKQMASVSPEFKEFLARNGVVFQ